MACVFWQNKFNAGNGMYGCSDCSRDLKPKMSNSAKNPGRTFVSCSKDFGGCGLFSFIDEEPRFAGGKATGVKRAKPEGTSVIGPISNAPSAHEERLAELVTEIADLRRSNVAMMDMLKVIQDYIKETTDN